MNKNHPPPYLRSLATCKKVMIKSGYTENFVLGNSGFTSATDNRLYDQAQVNIVATMRFEGNDSSREHAELYVIETNDGVKGYVARTHL